MSKKFIKTENNLVFDNGKFRIYNSAQDVPADLPSGSTYIIPNDGLYIVYEYQGNMMTRKLVTHQTTNSSGARVGEMRMFYGTTAPAGWHICDGTSFDETSYPELYDILGDNHFPDMRECTPIGVKPNPQFYAYKDNRENFYDVNGEQLFGVVGIGTPTELPAKYYVRFQRTIWGLKLSTTATNYSTYMLDEYRENGVIQNNANMVAQGDIVTETGTSYEATMYNNTIYRYVNGNYYECDIYISLARPNPITDTDLITRLDNATHFYLYEIDDSIPLMGSTDNGTTWYNYTNFETIGLERTGRGNTFRIEAAATIYKTLAISIQSSGNIQSYTTDSITYYDSMNMKLPNPRLELTSKQNIGKYQVGTPTRKVAGLYTGQNSTSRNMTVLAELPSPPIALVGTVTKASVNKPWQTRYDKISGAGYYVKRTIDNVVHYYYALGGLLDDSEWFEITNSSEISQISSGTWYWVYEDEEVYPQGFYKNEGNAGTYFGTYTMYELYGNGAHYGYMGNYGDIVTPNVGDYSRAIMTNYFVSFINNVCYAMDSGTWYDINRDFANRSGWTEVTDQSILDVLATSTRYRIYENTYCSFCEKYNINKYTSFADAVGEKVTDFPNFIEGTTYYKVLTTYIGKVTNIYDDDRIGNHYHYFSLRHGHQYNGDEHTHENTLAKPMSGKQVGYTTITDGASGGVYGTSAKYGLRAEGITSYDWTNPTPVVDSAYTGVNLGPMTNNASPIGNVTNNLEIGVNYVIFMGL